MIKEKKKRPNLSTQAVLLSIFSEIAFKNEDEMESFLDK